MNFEKNINWIIDQPASFWITAVILAVVANYSTAIISSSVVKSLGYYRSFRLNYSTNHLIRYLPYINSGNMPSVLPANNGTLTRSYIIISIFIAFITYARTRIDSSQISFILVALLLILFAAMLSLTFSVLRLYRYAWKIFDAFCVQKTHSTDDQSMIAFIASSANVDADIASEVFAKRRSLTSKNIRKPE